VTGTAGEVTWVLGSTAGGAAVLASFTDAGAVRRSHQQAISPQERFFVSSADTVFLASQLDTLDFRVYRFDFATGVAEMEELPLPALSNRIGFAVDD
jgi:hypothetical protein